MTFSARSMVPTWGRLLNRRRVAKPAWSSTVHETSARQPTWQVGNLLHSQKMKCQERAHIRDAGHIGELDRRPAPASRFAAHHRNRRHTLHGKREKHQQRTAPNPPESSRAATPPASPRNTAAILYAVYRPQCADNHLASRQRRDQPDPNLPIEPLAMNLRVPPRVRSGPRSFARWPEASRP